MAIETLPPTHLLSSRASRIDARCVFPLISFYRGMGFGRGIMRFKCKTASTRGLHHYGFNETPGNTVKCERGKTPGQNIVEPIRGLSIKFHRNFSPSHFSVFQFYSTFHYRSHIMVTLSRFSLCPDQTVTRVHTYHKFLGVIRILGTKYCNFCPLFIFGFVSFFT